MTEPTKETWEHYRGDSQDKYWPVFDSAGEPIADATGWTARVHIRYSANSALLHEWDPAVVDVGANPADPSVSTVRVYTPIAPDDEFSFAKAKYDVEVTTPAGKVKTLYAGEFKITSDYTHDEES